MAIKFHCENCGQKVKAPDETGGKRGQCPCCKKSVYIPRPQNEIEEIPLKPLSPEDERQEREAAREAARLKAEFDKMSQNHELPPDDSSGNKPDSDQIRKRMQGM